MSDPSVATLSSHSSSSSSVVKRACDACHRRKVKCIGDGSRPCKNCTSAGLTCTYNAVPQKKGPKGSRAKVISELRESQRQSQAVVGQRLGFDEPIHSPAYLRNAGLLSVEMITICVEYYFANLYPTQPILHRGKVGETIGQMENDVEAYCLVTSLCAYVMIQPNLVLPVSAFRDLDIPPQPSPQLGHALLQETLRVRKGCNYVENPTIWSVITSFYLFGSYFCLDKQNTAWFHLREATTLTQIMGMHEEALYQTSDLVENSRKRRLYWLLFLTERAYALQQHRPLSLHATINLPTIDEDPAETIELSGFMHLVNLFRPFDDSFVGLWNKTSSTCSTEWLAQLQQQLAEALPAYLQSTETQAVDLRCSQQWLRTMVWQLSITHGNLSSAASDNAMSFKYPIEIARDLLACTSTFSQQAMEVHGVGLIEKLFDVACTLTDVLSCVPLEQNNFEYGPREYLHQLMALIASLRGGQQRYLPLLIAKINDTVPAMQIPSYALPMAARGDDFYDSNSHSAGHSSATTSGGSTPFGSPPLEAPVPHAFLRLSTENPSSPFAGVTQPVQFPDIPTSIPAEMYQAPASGPMHGYAGMQQSNHSSSSGSR